MCVSATKSKTRHREKLFGSEWDLASSSEVIISLGNFNGHVGKSAEGFLKMYTGGMVLGKKIQKEENCWSFMMKMS